MASAELSAACVASRLSAPPCCVKTGPLGAAVGCTTGSVGSTGAVVGAAAGEVGVGASAVGVAPPPHAERIRLATSNKPRTCGVDFISMFLALKQDRRR